VLGFPVSAARKAFALLAVVPTVFLFVIGVADHGRVKSAFIRAALRGVARAALEEWTERFVPQLLTHGVFANALERIEQHRSEGARLVLMSASTDLYVPAIGNALKFDHVICTGVKWDGDRLDGHLSTPNRRGREKARCFEELRNAHPGLVIAAYGNTGSDLEHLRLADRPLLVNGSSSARVEAARMGIPCTRWR